MTEPLLIARDELHTAEVNAAVERANVMSRIQPLEPAPVSPVRRLLLSSLFYLPLAGALASLATWVILEPHFNDRARIGGEVVLVNSEPFEVSGYGSEFGDAIVLTVGTREIVVVPGETRMEKSVHGDAAFADIADIAPGTILEATGQRLTDHRMLAGALRPATRERADAAGQFIEGDSSPAKVLFFPMTAVLIVLALSVAEGVSSRNWTRMLERSMFGTLLTALFALVAFVPAGICMFAGELVMMTAPGFVVTIEDLSPVQFLLFVACRSAAWVMLGAGLGLGMNIVRSTRIQLRNSVIGGALGGALGGLFFDPVDRFLATGSLFQGGEISRLVGLVAVGLCVGLFVALVERLAREAWIRVKTGPLAGKSFVLYHTPTTIGSSSDCSIYLFKDSAIDPLHAEIHRTGNRYEIEDAGSRTGTVVAGRAVRRRRLDSTDQIVIGDTVLEFEERAEPRPAIQNKRQKEIHS